MSVRIDGDSLSLRTLFCEQKKSVPLNTPASATPSLFSLGISSQSSAPVVTNTPATGLKFDLKGLQSLQRQTESAPVAALQHAAPQHAALRNVFENQKTLQAQQDVLRLTAACDDLGSRLKAAQSRALTAESNLQRMQAAMMQERQYAGNRLKAVNSEIEASRAVEKKLRDELTRSQVTLK